MEAKGIWWKIYFWFSAIALIYLVYAFLLLLAPYKSEQLPSPTSGDWIFGAFYIVLLIGLWAFVFGKRSLASLKFWKIIFWVVIAYVFQDFLYFVMPEGLKPSILMEAALTSSFSGTLISHLVAIPNYYAIYWLAYKQKS